MMLKVRLMEIDGIHYKPADLCSDLHPVLGYSSGQDIHIKHKPLFKYLYPGNIQY